MPQIFLSYCREDQLVARRFAEGFEREGFSVWWDQSLTPGEAFDKVTERALEEAGAVVVLWSKHAVDSRWVRAEATQASAQGTLVPVMIEPCKRPIMFELTHTADLAHWNGDPEDRGWQTFVAGVRRVVGKDAPAPRPVQSTTPGATRTVIRRHRARAVAVATAALLLIGAGAWVMSRKTGDAAPAAVVTLAVLPFADLSEKQDQGYFSDGLTEELLNQLAQVEGLRVTARTSSFSFKGRNEDVRVIAGKLGVDNLLEGSVRRDGAQLRISAKLVRDGSQLWSKIYAREVSDVFAVQEEVAKDVARALSVKLDVGRLPRLQGGTNNIEAYDKYLQARQFYLQGGRIHGSQAVVLLREAVALDQNFSRAWLLQTSALIESLTGVSDHDAEAEPARKEWAEAAKRVMELAPDAWWAQSPLVGQFIRERKWAQAEAAVKASTAPSAYYEDNGPRRYFLESVGRPRESARQLEEAKQLDPLSFSVSADLQAALDESGRPEQAQVEYQRSLGLVGIHQRANVYALLRLLRRDDATPDAIGRQFRILLDSETLLMPASHALAKIHNEPAKVRRVISAAIDDPANDDRVRMAVVTMYADAFKEKDLAFRALERSVTQYGNTAALWFPFRPGMRTDRRFKDLVRATGLADYFRASGNWGDFCQPVGADDFECR